MTNLINSEAWWDDIAKVWTEKSDNRDRPEEYAKLIEIMGGFGSVFELGCGFGAFSKYLAPTAQYVGMDISKQMVEQARKKCSARVFVHGDITKMDMSAWEKAFTWTACFQTLEHFSVDVCRVVVKKLMNMSKTGLVFSLPTRPATAHQGHILEWHNSDEVLAFFKPFGTVKVEVFEKHFLGSITR